jgi:hypothetical protein
MVPYAPGVNNTKMHVILILKRIPVLWPSNTLILDACSKILLLPCGGLVLHVSLPQSEARWQSSYGLLECADFVANADVYCGLNKAS